MKQACPEALWNLSVEPEQQQSLREAGTAWGSLAVPNLELSFWAQNQSWLRNWLASRALDTVVVSVILSSPGVELCLPPGS